ncbi:MAG: hypothetical protein ACI9LM_002041 [Alteromonadaceae bacterium]|jgi:hypothetical protein
MYLLQKDYEKNEIFKLVATLSKVKEKLVSKFFMWNEFL